MTSPTTNLALYDADQIRQAVALFGEPGQLMELRVVPLAEGGPVLHGYYDNATKLFQDAAAHSGKAGGVYIVMSRIHPAVSDRADVKLNKLVTGSGAATDEVITRRRHILIDVDPVTPVKKVSATDAERKAALQRAKEIRDYLVDLGWPAPVAIASGNGGQLVFACDWEANPTNANRATRLLQALHFRFSDDVAAVDTKVGNHARIWKLPGTMACKGKNSTERPWRLAKILKAPDDWRQLLVTEEQAEYVIAQLLPEAPPKARPTAGPSLAIDDLGAWLGQHGIDARGPITWQDGRKWLLKRCPFGDHGDGVMVAQFASGGTLFKCHHNSCDGYKWQDFREHAEPGYRDQQRQRAQESYRGPAGGASPKPNGNGYGNSGGHAQPEDDARPWAPQEESAFGRALPPFPLHVLPRWLRHFVEGLAAQIQVPPDMPGMLVLAAVATAMAKRVRVCPRLGWYEPVNVYVVACMESANRKSAVVKAIVDPIMEFEARIQETRKEERAAAENRRRLAEEELKAAQQEVRKAKPAEKASLEARCDELAKELARVRVPADFELISDDSTPEKVAQDLAAHGGRLAIISAEGNIFDIMGGLYNDSQPNINVFLKAHAGDLLKVRRLGREPDYAQSPALTMGVTVQPEVIRGLIAKPTFRGRGLLGRFLYTIPGSLVGRRQVGAPAMAPAVAATYKANMMRLLARGHAEGEMATDAEVIGYDAEAQDLLQRFERWLEPHLAAGAELGYMQDWAGKLAGAVVRISGLLHVAERMDDEAPWGRTVSRDTAARAITLAAYLIEHAEATYDEMGSNAVLDGARIIVEWARRKDARAFSRRELQQALKRYFRNAKDLDASLKVMCEEQILRTCQPKTPAGPGRKPGPWYEINPAAFEERKVDRDTLGQSLQAHLQIILGGEADAQTF